MTVKIILSQTNRLVRVYNTSAAVVSAARYLTDVVFGRFHVVRAQQCIHYSSMKDSYTAWTGIINTTLSLLILYYTNTIQVLSASVPFCVGSAYTRHRAIYETMPTKPEDLGRGDFRSLFFFSVRPVLIISLNILCPRPSVQRVCITVHISYYYYAPIGCSSSANILYYIVFGARSVMITLLYSIESVSVQMIDQLIGCAKHNAR